jgi:hypothetical protein
MNKAQQVLKAARGKLALERAFIFNLLLSAWKLNLYHGLKRSLVFCMCGVSLVDARRKPAMCYVGGCF